MSGFDRIIGQGVDEAIVAHVDEWRKPNIEKTRVSINACAFNDFDLGGSSENSIPGIVRIAAYERRPFIVRDDWYLGFVYNLFVEMMVESGGSVTAFLVDEDDTILWTSGPCTATTWQEQTTTFTPVVNVKHYLHFQKADDDHAAYGYGRITTSAKAL